MSIPAILNTSRPTSPFRKGAVVVAVFTPPRKGVVVAPEALPFDEVLRLTRDEALPRSHIPVQWGDGSIEAVDRKYLRLCELSHGTRVYRHAGGPRRYGTLLRPGQARGMAYRAALLDGEWATIRWDDGSLENVETKNLTPIILP